MIFFHVSLAVITLNIAHVTSQSNYASHANNVNYIGKGLPEETVLDGKVSVDEPWNEFGCAWDECLRLIWWENGERLTAANNCLPNPHRIVAN